MTAALNQYRLHEDSIASVNRHLKASFDYRTDPYRAKAIAGALFYSEDRLTELREFGKRLDFDREIHAGLVARLMATGLGHTSAIEKSDLESASAALRGFEEQLRLTEETGATFATQIAGALETQGRWASELAREEATLKAWLRQSVAQLEVLHSEIQAAAVAASLKASLALYVPDSADLLRMAATSGLLPDAFLDPATDYALASLAALSEAIAEGPFEADTVEALRSELGDAREAQRHDGETTPTERSEPSTAEESGQHKRDESLEPRIAAAPLAVLTTILRVTGLEGFPPPPLVLEFSLDHATPALSEEEVSDASKAFGLLLRLESQLRALVERKLAPTGGRWFVQRCPETVVQRCRDRRQQRGRPQDRLIVYTDLGDLQQIICRNDNWPFFEPHFKRREGVQEAFARLVPLRNDLMHGRPLVAPDNVYFYVEVYRLWRAIDVPDADQLPSADDAPDDDAPDIEN